MLIQIFSYIIFCIKSDFVRLGEYDISRTDDGTHQDMEIFRVFPHRKYVRTPKINDIAIVLLYRDVEFTGKLDIFFSVESSLLLTET